MRKSLRRQLPYRTTSRSSLASSTPSESDPNCFTPSTPASTPFESPYSAPPTSSKSPLDNAFLSVIIKYNAIRHVLSVPVTLHLRASQLTNSFLEVSSESDKLVIPGNCKSTGELLLRFSAFIVTLLQSPDTNLDDNDILKLVLDDFQKKVLGNTDIHILVKRLSGTSATNLDLLQWYYTALTLAGYPIKVDRPAILRSTKTRVVSIFGGQGITKDYLDELRETFHAYRPLVEHFVVTLSEVLTALDKAPGVAQVHPRGLCVMRWLVDPDSAPEPANMIMTSISMPLIGLLQLVNYYVLCKVAGMTPGDMPLACASGHSQGIVAAVVTAAATSWESLEALAVVAIQILFWIGLRSQQNFSAPRVAPAIARDSVEHDEGAPSPMLGIRGLTRDLLDTHIKNTNHYLPESLQIEVSLVNSPRNFVVTGPPLSLHGLNLRLRKIQAPKDQDLNQSRLLFKQRKILFTKCFLPVTAPFHSKYTRAAITQIDQDLERVEILSSSLRYPVLDTTSGHDLSKLGDRNLVPHLVRLILRDHVHWDKASQFPAGTTHALDFGPGRTYGVGALTNSNLEGCGTRVMLPCIQSGSKSDLGYMPELMDNDESAIMFAPKWSAEYSPKLVKTSTGKVYVDTKLSRLLGLPPVIVAGMTPTTVDTNFVVKTIQAGYHIELAGGGYHTEQDLRNAIGLVAQAIPPGRGITLNLIYVNPRQISWQIPLVKTLRAEGFPIEGITIGAGIPSPQIAKECITTLGLRHISFKPGNTSGIEAVINIAKASPDFPVILQWTGGRGGGHHSFEDFHEPILQTYGKIRACANIILVAGSGFGAAEDTLPYLTGTWSHKFGRSAKMPFDGFLIGSRAMVAQEAPTSLACKQAIAQTAGLDDADWEKTCQDILGAGGVISVISEMGEPVHMLATRGVLLWAELDKKIFSLPREDRVPALQRDARYIMDRLNADFQKVWFGVSPSRSPTQLESMCYSAIAARLVELLFTPHERRWIDQSYQQLVWDFLVRMEQRFSTAGKGNTLLQDYAQLEHPYQVLQKLLAAYPATNSKIIIRQDAENFLLLCRRPGQKPVNFIPTLDEHFETYFKKDSLWQSGDLAAVVGQDVGRVCILQGPVAVKHTQVIDEPIKDILGRIHGGHIKYLIRDVYGGKATDIPKTGYFDGSDKAESVPEDDIEGLEIQYGAGQITYRLSKSLNVPLPPLHTWSCLLSGQKRTWKTAILLSDSVLRDQTIGKNPVTAALAPMRGSVAVIMHYKDPQKTVIQVKEPIETDEDVLIFEAKLCDTGEICVDLLHKCTSLGQPVPLSMLFSFHPDHGFAPVREIMERRNRRIQNFFWRTWFGNESIKEASLHDHFEGGHFTITEADVKRFVHTIRASDNDYSVGPSKTLTHVPMSFAIVIVWRAILRPLFCIDADLLTLVHLSNTFELLPNCPSLIVGETVSTCAKVLSVKIQESGKVVTICGLIYRNKKPVMRTTSAFLYRGSWQDFENTFENREEEPTRTELTTVKDVAVLMSKSWFHSAPGVTVSELLGCTLEFRLKSLIRWKDRANFSQVKTTGLVSVGKTPRDMRQVGTVEYDYEGTSQGNPVTAYLKRFGTVVREATTFNRPIQLHSKETLAFRMPESNEAYAKASGDYNPIHLSRVFSRMMGLPGMISHGMHTSAIVRNLVGTFAADDGLSTVTKYTARFVGMVLPGDEIEVRLLHTGMLGGRKLVKIEAKNKDGVMVLTGDAEIEQPLTAYVFTGQGSQKQGMGMDLYASSHVARSVWDTADRYFMDNFGFAISHIVRDNPKELTIFFGGKNGQQLRQNYMAMTYQTITEFGEVANHRMFETIDDHTQSYTYTAAGGLLNATQFTQPALTIMEKARFEDMKSKGLVDSDSSFAGHSLGEYGALSSMTDIMPVEKLVSIVFFRGMTMQNVVKRDHTGQTGYSMSAVNPSKVAASFDEDALQWVVDKIENESNWLLEIVNYNISNLQYVCAGSIKALHCLSDVLAKAKAGDFDLTSLMAAEDNTTPEGGKLLGQFMTMLKKSIEDTLAVQEPIDLKRDAAIVPLKSIEVPFHSTFLQPGVAAYREFLLGRLDKKSVNPAQLVGKWIPNVTGKPFGISREEFEEVCDITGSTVLQNILENWHKYQASVGGNQADSDSCPDERITI